MICAPICNTAALRVLERHASSAPLMELAGAAAAGVARLLAPSIRAPVVVFAGPGNNGGDGFVVARHLRQWGYTVTVVFGAQAERLPPDAHRAWARWTTDGGTCQPGMPALGECGLIVDALFGIGLTRDLTGTWAEWIAAINRADCPVLALDVPSGLDADTGAAHGAIVRATHTATFIALKPGLLTGEGVDAAGRVSVHDLGLDVRAAAVDCGDFVTWDVARGWRVPRRRNSHKGSHGTLGIVGGAPGMTGAALLAGRAALMAGAGKVFVGFVGFVGECAPGADMVQPELMLRGADDVLRADCAALVVGPGLSQARLAADHLGRALARPAPLVLDADALNLIAQEPGLAQRLRNRSYPTVLTPHPAEAARLLQTSTAVVQSNRIDAAQRLVESFGAMVALKGAGTVCAFADRPWSINGSGNAGLATAGSGDVLSGVIGALLAQGYAAERALLLGVCVHGAAADALVAQGVGPIGLTASELAPAVRQLLNER